MESKENVEFGTLIERYHSAPEQKPSETDLILLEGLMDSYLDADPQPGTEILVYKKLTEFYNVFLEAYFKEHPTALQHYPEPNEASLQVKYPVFKALAAILSKKRQRCREEANLAYLAFVMPISHLINQKEKDILSTNTIDGHSYASPEPNPNDLSTLPVCEVAQRVYSTAESKQGSELKLMVERDTLVKTYYRQARAEALHRLYRLYEELNVTHLMKIPHIGYITSSTERMPYLYASSSTHDIFPHPLFEKLLKLSFQRECGHDHRKFMTEVLGKIHTEDRSSPFYGYRVSPKKLGKEPGFILVSKDGKDKVYAKYTKEMMTELFASKVLSHLGIKMPEAFLISDEYKNRFYLTKNVAREYSKEEGGQLKTKEFSTLQYALDQTAPEVAFNMRRMGAPSLDEQEKSVNAFLEEFTHTPQSRISFAKLLIAAATLGLLDFGIHGGNVGVIRSQKPGKEPYHKFTIIDFQFEPQPLPPTVKPLKYITDMVLGGGARQPMTPIFQKIYNRLTREDVLAAAEQLAQPKTRHYSKEGLLWSSPLLSKTTTRAVVTEAFSETARELKKLGEHSHLVLGPIFLKSLTVTDNLELFIAGLVKELSAVPHDPKEGKEMSDIKASAVASSRVPGSGEGVGTVIAGAAVEVSAAPPPATIVVPISFGLGKP
jgi:hypothetical protein